MTEREPFLYPGKRMALLRRVGRLTVDELHALDAAVRELAATKAHKHQDKGFMFAWWEGPHINGDEELELQGLFSAILVALASGLSGIDVEKVGAQFAPKPSISESIFRLMLPASPSRRLQDASIGLIEATLAPWDPRRAIVATWNMACAAALRERLRPTTIEALEAAWRTAIGEPPI